MNKLILVNKRDKIIGYQDKNRCHRGRGILHRAFTVFIFNDKNQVLIQKRSKNKLLWPLFWETSCSSHPRKGESLLKVAKKRLKKELGVSCQLRVIGKFHYQASYRNIGSENEVCAILIGKCRERIKPSLKEIAIWRWINLKELKEDTVNNPNKYAPWLKIGLRNFLRSNKKL